MSRPNRNGILSCRDCGEYTHVKHARDGRCTECDDRYQDECVQAEIADEDVEPVEALRLAGAA